ncbi:MAG TPA: folylpolyglutamate synthase/dihydrofolate synthase family protein, partial [Coleofasciculaceae cyanobacterium]
NFGGFSLPFGKFGSFYQVLSSALEPFGGGKTMGEALDRQLASFQPLGIKLGLERMMAVLAALGNPQAQVPIVHVAGTNGKGSVCAYVSSILTAAGYRTGRYTSPHLVDWTERITIDQEPIDPDVLAGLIAEVERAIAQVGETLTQFELVTAAAWLHFARQAVDVAVIEVGLGGRLDATNVVDEPIAWAITSIGRDHWQVLGDTLGQIAAEKAGILKAGRPGVVAPLPPDARAVVAERAERLACPIDWIAPAEPIEPPASSVPSIPSLPSGQSWARSGDLTYPLALAGAVQLTNSAVAIGLVRQLRSAGWAISDSAIQAGMAATRWPGRLQWATWQGRSLLVDGAHNADSALVLRAYVDSCQLGPVTWVVGMLATKDPAAVLSILLRSGDRLLTVPVPDPQSIAPADLAALGSQTADLDQSVIFTDLAPALEAACAGDRPVVLCGSLYLLGQFFRMAPAADRPLETRSRD